MFAEFLKTSGVDQLAAHSVIIIAIAMSTIAVIFGWLASWVTRVVSFGVLTNATIAILSMAAGIVLYNHKIAPLKHADPAMLVAVTIGSAVLGLMLTIFVRVRPYRA